MVPWGCSNAKADITTCRAGSLSDDRFQVSESFISESMIFITDNLINRWRLGRKERRWKERTRTIFFLYVPTSSSSVLYPLTCLTAEGFNEDPSSSHMLGWNETLWTAELFSLSRRGVSWHNDTRSFVLTRAMEIVRSGVQIPSCETRISLDMCDSWTCWPPGFLRILQFALPLPHHLLPTPTEKTTRFPIKQSTHTDTRRLVYRTDRGEQFKAMLRWIACFSPLQKTV